MRIIIVSATQLEIQPLITKLNCINNLDGKFQVYKYKKLNIDILLTGAGINATSYYLGKTLSDAYDLAINLGIAGSFNPSIQIGEVVNVVSDRFSDLGAEDGSNFLSVFDMGLYNLNEHPFINGALESKYRYPSLKNVKAITVNTVHGNETSIAKVVKKFSPDIETMEGAAFSHACLCEGIPFAQIRSISNYVEKRNKNNWQLPAAIENLNTKAIEIIDAMVN